MLKEIEFDGDKMIHIKDPVLWAQSYEVGVSNAEGDTETTLDRVIIFMETEVGILALHLDTREKAKLLIDCIESVLDTAFPKEES